MKTKAKGRPRLRQVIIEQKLTPFPALKAWNGYSAWCDGHQTFLSEGLKKQMRKMIVEGFWTGKLTLNTVLSDASSYTH